MPSAARLRRPQRLAALVALLLALLVQALWMPRMAVAQAAGVEVCSAQGHRRIALPSEDGHPQHQHGLDCCCPAGWAAAPPPEAAAVALLAHRQAPPAAPPGAAPSLDWYAPLSRGPPLSLH
ncbi:DUF2946 family protein [Azohydromonas caseinilytica]|uniref:DUF2946 family protein n=1 Tax=Azohydromonas caseinilytica TaxID=2728836 RepID=A0A848FC55_9BURK|nr:DUF2946 family protein [Azohydromonas caseinilytica]NML16902.1 DUF2946 family protein [Azohydromonas caseinilytica]